MRRLNERMEQAKTVLKELSHQPLRRTALEQIIIRKGSTHATFEGIFHFLVNDGYIQKTDKKHTADYTITEKGTKLLEALK